MFGRQTNQNQYVPPRTGLFGNAPTGYTIFSTANNNNNTRNIFGSRVPSSITTKLFTDQNSPWKSTPQQIKQLFNPQLIALNQIELKDINSIVRPCVSFTHYPPNICSGLVKSDCASYRCYTCMRARKQTSYTLAICSQCFILEDHQDHYYEAISSASGDSIFSLSSRTKNQFCICGMDLFHQGSANLKCKKHSQTIKDFQLDQQNTKQLITLWKSLFDIYMYIEAETSHSQAYQKIGNFLYNQLKHFINTQTIYNIRVVSQFLKLSIDLPTHPRTKLKIIHLFMLQNRQENSAKKQLNLMMNLMNDLKFANFFVEQLINLTQNSEQQVIELINIPNNVPIIPKMRQDLSLKLFPHYPSLFSYQQIALITIKHYKPQLLNNFIIEFHKKCEKRQNEFIDTVMKIFSDIKNGSIVKYCASYLIPTVLKIMKSQNGHQKQSQVDNQQQQNANNLIKIFNAAPFRKFMNKLVFSYCDTHMSKIMQFIDKFQSYFPSYQHQEQLPTLAHQLCKYIKQQYLSTSHLSYPHLLLTSTNPKNINVLQKYFQNMLTEKKKSLFQTTQSQNYSYDRFIYLVLLVVFGQFYFNRYEDLDTPKTAQQQQQKYKQQRQYRQLLLRQCIYQIKTLKNAQTLKQQFRIPNFREIIKQMMQYNTETRQFQYKQNIENSQYNNPSAKLLAGLFGQNQQQYILNNFNIKSREHFNNLPEFNRKLAEELFLKSNIIEKLKQFWEICLNAQNHQLSSMVQTNQSAKYLQTLIFIDILTDSKNTYIRQYLQKLQNDKQQRTKLQARGSAKTIYYLLNLPYQEQTTNNTNNMNQSNSQQTSNIFQKQQQNAQQKQQLKKRSQLTKRQKYAKMKQKQQAFIDSYIKLTTDSFNRQISEEGQQCLLCHQKTKKDNRLVYLMKVMTKYTECRVLFGQSDVPKTQITSCFHPMHFNCCMAQYEKKQSLKCPLCSKTANAILPHNYYPQQKKINRVCTNIIIHNFFKEYKIYDIENLFIILFKHLIQSKAFSSLINIHRYKDNKVKRQKIDLYIENFLTEMYELSNQQTKKQYEESMLNLQKQIQLVDNKQFKIIQEIFWVGIRNKIRNQQCMEQNQSLLELAKNIKYDEFQIIRNQAEDIGVYCKNPNDNQTQNIQIVNPDNHNKVSLKKQFPIKPPQYAHQLKRFGQKRCHYCSRPVKQKICLICGLTMCGGCQQSKNHGKNHQQRLLTFIFDESKIEYTTETSQQNVGLFNRSNNRQRSQNLYYNQLMVQFSKISYPETNSDIFQLNEDIYKKYKDYLFN